MIITPKGPVTSDSSNTQPSQSAQDARSRALAKLVTPNSQESPVLNPNSVSPEEASLVMRSQESESPEASQEGQEIISESQVESSAEEAKSEVTEKKAESEDPLSKQFAQLARKEKAIRAKMQEIKAAEAAIKAREQALLQPKQSPQQDDVSLKDRLAKDPLKALSDMGLSYEKLTELMLGNNVDPEQQARMAEVEALKAEIQAIKQAQENSVKSYEEQQKQQYQQAINNLKMETKSLVSSSEEFETIRETGSIDDVVDLIEQTFKQDGILMTVEEAAKAVEEYLVEEAIKIARLKKIQSRLMPKQEAVKQPASSPQPQASGAPQKQGMKTLTNSVGASRPLTAKERALLAFEGKLKQ